MPPPPLARAKRPAVSTPPPVVAVKERPPQRKPPPLPPSNAAALAALRKGDKKPAADPAQKELQDKVGNGAVAAGLTRSPAKDPKFGVLKKDVKQKKRKVATSHPPPSKEATSAQDAALPPKDDEVAQGKEANAEKMNEAKPKEFDKDAFVKAVEKAVADKSPKNLKEAEEFPDSEKPADIKKDVQDRVGEGKTDSADQIATTTAAPPDTSAAVTKQVVPMAADRPPGTPATPDPTKATPDKLPLSATDMSAGPAAVDQQMTDAQITEPQLKKSNEPTFNAALDDKKSLEAHSETAPDQLRKAEAAKLQATTAQAKRMGTNAMGAIGAQRVTTGQQVGAGKTNTKTTDEEKRAEVTGILQKVFDTMKTDVEGILTGLDKLVEDQFNRGEKEARDAFTAEHKKKIQEYKDRRYSGWRKILWVQDWLLGLPDEANQMIDEARANYIRQMRRVIEGIATTIANELKRAKDRIAKGREDIQTEVKKLPKDLQSIGKQAAADFADQFDELTQSVDDKGTELVDTLATKYTDAVKSVDAEVAAEKEKNEGAAAKAAKAVKGVIETIKELKRLLLGVLAKAAQAVMGILKDPIGFLGGLITGVGGGLSLFGKNARRHLEGGVIAWLLGTGVTGGLQLPTSFDILGILLMLAALLGLSAANLRTRLARKVPPKAMAAAEAGTDAIPMVVEVRKRGVAGMWSDLKGRVGDLKKELISGLVSYLLPTIIIAGITWIVSLFNPASAFIRACKMIIDIIRFIVTQGRQIIEFINAVLDAVIAISKGGAGGVPPLIERALAKSIPVLIGALAAILGVGGIAGKVREIFQKLARPVNRAIDWVIDKLAGLVKKLWAKIKSKFDKKKPKKHKDPRKPRRDDDADKRKRLRAALNAAVRVVNRFRGRRVRGVLLKPLLTGIRLRYRLRELRPEPHGKVWSVHAAASPAESKDSAALVDGKEAPDTDEKKEKKKFDPQEAYASQLNQAHPQARPAILRALKKIVKKMQPWPKAKDAIQGRDTTIKKMDQKPLLQEHKYGDWAHDEAAKKTLNAFKEATGSPADDAEAKRIAASVRQFGDTAIGVTQAKKYLANYKNEVHKPATPFDSSPTPVSLFREAIWNEAQMQSALTRIQETMLARIKMGADPPPQEPLPEDDRKEVLRMLQNATLTVTPQEPNTVLIEVDQKTTSDITDYLARRAGETNEPDLKKALEWWKNNVLTMQWHHAWPKWLGGEENQTDIKLPRVLHQFDGIDTDPEAFPGGFHQILNAKIRTVFPDVSVNIPDSWTPHKSVPKDVKIMGTLIAESYHAVFARFKAKEQARKRFIDEASEQMQKLLKALKKK